MGMGRRVAATDHSWISATGDRKSRSGLWQLPSGRTYAHFAEPEQESRPGISISRILGMGSYTKIPGPGWDLKRAALQTNTKKSVHALWGEGLSWCVGTLDGQSPE